MKLDTLQAGKYLLVYKFDWIPTQHPERKVVLNLYAPKCQSWKIGSIKKGNPIFNRQFLNMSLNFLKKRERLGPNFVQPELFYGTLIGSEQTDKFIQNYKPRFSMQDFDYTELQIGTQNQAEDIYYRYILQDERDRNELTTSKEFKFAIP